MYLPISKRGLLYAFLLLLSNHLVKAAMPPDTCNVPTFQKTYGGTGNDVSNDIRITPDGGYILAGNTTSFGVAGTDGYLVKVNAQGDVLWSKTYGGTGNDIFSRITVTPDGGCLVVGQTKSYGFLTGAAWVVKTDALGNVQWTNQYGENSPNGEIFNSVRTLADGGYVITGRHDSAPTEANALVVKIDRNGTLVWAKIFDSGDTDLAGDVIEDNGGLLILGYTRVSASYHDGILMKLNSANGSFLWMKRLEVDGRNNLAGYLHRQGNNYILNLPTLNNLANANTFRNVILTTDLDGNIIDSKEILAPANSLNGSHMFVPDASGGFVALQSDNSATADLGMLRVAADGTVAWSRKYPRAGMQANTSLRMTQDGGYVTAGYTGTAGNYDMYITRTDAMGYTPGCDTTALPITISHPPYSTTTFSWQTTRNHNFQGIFPVPVQGLPVVSATSSLCAGVGCATTPGSMYCTQRSSFRKTYATPANERVYDVLQTTDDNFVMAGETATNALLFKINARGDTLWTRTIGGIGTELFYRVKQTTDGGYIAVGYSQSFGHVAGDVLLVKADASGGVTWSKVFGAGTANGEKGSDVIQTNDGGYAIAGIYNATSSVSDILVIKTDANGNLQWNQRFDNGNTDWGTGIDQSMDTLIITGYTASTYYHDGILMKLNKNNGAVLWTKQFDRLQGNDGFYRFTKMDDGYLINGNYGQNFANTGFKHGITKTDINGNIIFAQLNNTPTTNNGSFSVSPTTDGGFLCVEGESNGNSDVFFYKFDAAGSPVFKKQFTQADNQLMSHAFESTDHSYMMAGLSQNDIFVIKTDVNANTDRCVVDSSIASLTASPYTIQNLTWSGITSVTFNSQAVINPTIGSAPFVMNTLCAFMPCESMPQDTCGSPVCNTLGLTGPDRICSLKDTVTYYAVRDSACGGLLTWNYDPAFVNLISSTDTSITVQFLQDGDIIILAQLALKCKLLQNNLLVSITSTHDSLNLGPDVQLCTDVTYVINAPAGFTSYLWQDGTTDPAFSANQPGTYFVTVTNDCGKALKDTVIVTAAPVINFNMGPDLMLCQSDTLSVPKPVGFTDYSWSPVYKIDTAQSKIFTDRDTTYIITAKASTSCPVTDTIHVTVLTPTPLHLGNDTSFCKNGMITLDGGPGFTSYNWSTGSTSQQIQVNAEGVYWLHATSNCVSKDTLVVTDVFDLPPVNLGNDFMLCTGSSHSFNAGTGFTTYTWQDGSGNPTYTTNQPGTYWVMVTDANNCSNADTVAITGIGDLPANFLPDTIQACDGQIVTLQPSSNYASYSWSDGTTSPTTTVHEFGYYWLEVTDVNGCKGSDTVQVADKECLIFIHFPNAFSPNGDQQNDLFRPKLSGILKHYHLTVYNRWGELVFETRDAGIGWDGMHKGLPQSATAFVWRCTYLFAGKKQVEKMEKGMVTVVR